MARIRTVKPEFWTDERVGEVSPNARLLFIGTWNFADDHGGIDRSAKQLKAQVFPYDQIDCEPLVQELLVVGLLVEYEANGKKYLHIKGFAQHQKVEKPGKPRVPIYEPSVSPPRIVGEASGKTPCGREKESKGREHPQREAATPDPDPSFRPSPAAAVCVAMKSAGVMDPSPSHPKLLALLERGATIGQFEDAAKRASAKRKGFAYALGIVERELTDAGDAADAAAERQRRAAALEAQWEPLRERGRRAGFREPWPVDTPETYETALKLHERGAA